MLSTDPIIPTSETYADFFIVPTEEGLIGDVGRRLIDAHTEWFIARLYALDEGTLGEVESEVYAPGQIDIAPPVGFAAVRLACTLTDETPDDIIVEDSEPDLRNTEADPARDLFSV